MEYFIEIANWLELQLIGWTKFNDILTFQMIWIMLNYVRFLLCWIMAYWYNGT